jgi:hypothetical protein
MLTARKSDLELTRQYIQQLLQQPLPNENRIQLLQQLDQVNAQLQAVDAELEALRRILEKNSEGGFKVGG